jgi:glutaredoxin 3
MVVSEKVRIFTIPTCSFCKMTKEFLTRKNIVYTDYDISTDADARDEMSRISGQDRSVPVIAVGPTVIIGFDESRIVQALTAVGLA